ncbi:Chondroitin sulfate ABC exolyase [Stylophora pistillata]|uniref:Chondroitin sulfate ABC exolyase n=1 Tax=Stylophora pistillata TaxID=50429 RepID=A0A2B4SMZ8_STYPI|nr:Chondroitin sulfate ABC exolyase [Stylophora pistillata]
MHVKRRSPGFSILLLTGVALLLIDQAAGNRCNKVLDFEDTAQQSCLVKLPKTQGKISFSTSVAKHGTTSLKWESGANGESKLRYKLPKSAHIKGRALRGGGVKMWIYKDTASTGTKMEVRLTEKKKKNSTRIGSFEINLGFSGWRGIWMSFAECKKTKNSLTGSLKITRMDFVLNHEDTIYIDLLGFVEKMSKQSRDKIVPTITKFGSKYDSSNFWQQTYRWSQQTPTALPTSVDSLKTTHLAHIESRLHNWYADETQTTYDFTGEMKKRWKTLQDSFDDAHQEYDRLTFTNKPDSSNPGTTKIVITAPPLFCRNCKMGTRTYSATDPTRKFSFPIMRIMLPLALEFYLKSRTNQITKTVAKERSKLCSGDAAKMQQSVEKICGKWKKRQDEFRNYLNTLSCTESNVRKSLNFINKARLQRILNLLDYIEEQGWADGSGIGSLDHEMNRDGAGYMHTLFLLKKSLHQNSRNRTRLVNLINTAKWYNDFGEVYQSIYEFKGTTADRMITILLFRLMIVLAMPATTEIEKKERQRDMDALKRWMDNALSINKAFGGVIKPDYTGFHHKAFYASAYAPHALQTAAQVQYLLEGTHFALSDASKRNLLEALKTMRLVSVKYSTPSSVGGRFPNFSKETLINILPAYAYIGVSYSSQSLASTPPKGITIPNSKDAGIFLRLYDTMDKNVKKYLEDGKVYKGKSYMNSLGCLKIMSALKSKATTYETSPEGHWSKNFAALSIHRRKDWAVTVKGFNRFVWDFEGSTKKKTPENAFGTYQSHGSMLIANSEEALKAHDIDNGWDWTKVPGATTMTLTLSQIRLKKARNFSPLSYAGGVTYKGPELLSSGVFGMDFHQPEYQFLDKKHPYPNIKLHFKKSVFFFQNVLVCLGSNIKIDNGGTTTKARTTLFQDKLVRGASKFSIQMDGTTKGSSDLFPAENPLSTNKAKGYTALVDTKGNSYFIPGSSASDLKVHVQSQTSQTAAAVDSSGIYATAWLEHISTNSKYEYAVLVKTASYKATATSLWDRQHGNGNFKLYMVLQQDERAHVVKFSMSLETNAATRPLYGYVIFQPTAELPNDGLITKVTKQCRIMVEDNPATLFLSISNPDLNFDVAEELETSGDINKKELYELESGEVEVEVTLAVDVIMVLDDSAVYAHGSPADYKPRVEVKRMSSSPPGKGNILVFKNLKNGFSVELKLKKS